MPKFKVVECGQEGKVVALKKLGKSSREIAKILTRDTGVKFDHNNILNYIHSHEEAFKEIARQKTEFTEQLLQQEIDVNSDLLFINNKAKEFIATYKGSDRDRAALLGVLQRQTEFISKRLGEVSDAPQITIINEQVNEFKTLMFEVIKEVGGEELERKFIIALKQHLGEEDTRRTGPDLLDREPQTDKGQTVDMDD